MIKNPLLAALLAGSIILAPAATSTAFAATPKPTSSATPSSSPSKSATPAKPQPARDIKLSKGDGDHEVKLDWRAPKGVDSKTKTRYFVNVTVTLGKKKLSPLTSANTTKTSFTYKDIPAGAKLRAEVTTLQRYALNEHDYSKTYTLAQLKPNAPRNVRLSATGLDLKTTWQAPNDDAGTLITGYRVTAYSANLDSGKREKAASKELKNPKKLTYTFKGLEGETNYYVMVEAENSEGYSKTAQSNNVETGADLGAKPTDTPAPTESATPEVTDSPEPTPTSTPTESTVPGGSSATTGPTPTVQQSQAAEVERALNGDNQSTEKIDAARGFLSTSQLVIAAILLMAIGGTGFVAYRFWRRY